MIATLSLAFVAGLLSIFSPCVLPLVPVVLGSAVAAHRAGPFALAAGMAVSFVIIGLFVATFGFAFGLDAVLFRNVAAGLMLLAGLVLASPLLQEQLSIAGAPFAGLVDHRLGAILGSGAYGQFGIGVLLGAVWSPCVGPTLGAASLLAAQGRDLGQVALTMTVFGVGAALPLLAMGLLSREALLGMRGRLKSLGRAGRLVLGSGLVVVAILILSGADKTLEAVLLARLPDWLVTLTTAY